MDYLERRRKKAGISGKKNEIRTHRQFLEEGGFLRVFDPLVGDDDLEQLSQQLISRITLADKVSYAFGQPVQNGLSIDLLNNLIRNHSGNVYCMIRKVLL